MTKTFDFLLKIFIFCFVFVSHLIFFTSFSTNPFIVQNEISIIAIFGSLFILACKYIKQENNFFSSSKADILILIFVAFALLSLGINLFFSEVSHALLNDFLRRGFTIITACLGGYLLARFLSNDSVFLEQELTESDNYKNGLLFFLWGILWLPFSCFRMASLFDIYGLLMWGLAFYIAFRFLKKINLKNILDILIITGTLAAAYGICQTLSYDFLWPYNFSKSFGSIGVSTFGNPNFLSSFLLFTLPVSIIFYLVSKTKLAKIYYLIINLIGISFILISQARSSWIGIFFACFVFICSKTFRRILIKNKTKIILLIAGLGLIFLIWPTNKNNIDKISDLQIVSQSVFANPKNLTLAAESGALNMAYHQRLMAWTCGIKGVKRNPLFGLGWGSWQLNYAPCQGELLKKYSNLNSLKIQSNSAHNILIETLTQSGIIGLILYILFLLLAGMSFIKYYKKQKDENKKIFFLAIFASCVGFFIDSLLNISYQLQTISAIFYFFVGVLVSLTVDKKIKLSKIKINFIVVLIGISLIFFCVRQFNALLASHYSLKANVEVKNNHYTQAGSFFDRSIKLSKSDPVVYFNYFKILKKAQNYTSINILLSETEKYFPYYYEFFDFKALEEAKLGKAKSAFDYIKKSFILNPQNPEILRLTLDIFSYFKELRTLENADFLESLNVLPYYQNAYNILLFQIYFENGKYDEARKKLLLELNKNIFDPNIQKMLAEVNKKLNITDDPILKEALKLSDLRRQLLQSDKIKDSLIKAIKEAAQDNNLDAQMLLAQAYFKKGDYKNCRIILTNLYKEHADFMPLNFAFASLEEAQGNKEEAKKYLKAILLLDKENKLALQRLNNLN